MGLNIKRVRVFDCYYKTGLRFFAAKTKTQEKKYTDTILLPKTDFPQWISSNKRLFLDEQILKHRGFDSLYKWQRVNVDGPEFILHDGPPYANGVPHMGHAINKVLKDIVKRYKLLTGYKVHYKLGWDCHGLPIELKALKGQTEVKPLEIRNRARQFAKITINDQKAIFKTWGLMADWEDCYHTYDKDYVKNQIRQFYELFNKGLIYRDMKPVYWSFSSNTALAEAELEYNPEHRSHTVFLRLAIVDMPGTVSEHSGGSPVYLLVWTTTPWTLPANKAVAYNANFEYALVKVDGSYYIVGKKLIELLQSKFNRKFEVISTFNGRALSAHQLKKWSEDGIFMPKELALKMDNKASKDGNVLKDATYKHPLKNETMKVFPASFVAEDSGTALVHIAPPHGPDDYLLALQHRIPIESVVDERGKYTPEAGEELHNLHVLDRGITKVLSMLKDDIVLDEKILHSYPYDWRTKKPVIVRACKQWFIDTKSIKDRAIETLKKIKIIPEKNISSFLVQLEQRPYWCISRQRAWGVPIPVLYDTNENTVISKNLIEHYCRLIDEKGTDFWWSLPVSELILSEERQGREPEQLMKGEDILDIWLDSGLSWSAVLGDQIADLYLEGVDQFTGWFQSSLLTSVAIRNRAPFKTIVSHGFSVDDKGRKMSKSLGNIVHPYEITHGGIGNMKKSNVYGIDGLRWWVAAHSLQHANIPVSKTTFSNSLESLKKLRNALKFLLGCLNDFPPDYGSPKLHVLDQYMLHRLAEFETKVINMYEAYELNKITLLLLNFIANDISSFYCHLIKDRLYCDEANSSRRRAAQYTINEIVHSLLFSFAPILPVLAEEVYQFHPHNFEKNNYFYKQWRRCQKPQNEEFVRSVMDKCIIVKEKLADIKPVNLSYAQLSCEVTADEEYWSYLSALQDEEYSTSSQLVELFQVSQVILRKSTEIKDFIVNLKVCKTFLCPRCRKYSSLNSNSLCDRCMKVLNL